MLRFFSMTLFVAIVGIACWGCTDAASTPASGNATAETGSEHGDTDNHETINVSATLCGSCGDTKGSESCCSETAAKCGDCGLNEGSKLCCLKLDADAAGKDLCGKCGNVAGSTTCCADGAEACASCGLTKGSALCCKEKADG